MDKIIKYLKGITGKIVAPFVVLIVLTIMTISVLSIRYAKKGLESQLAKKSEILVKNLAIACVDPLSVGELDRLNIILMESQDVDDDVVYIYLVDNEGKTMAQGRESSHLQNVDLTEFEDDALAANSFSSRRHSTEKELFELVHPVIFMGDKMATLRLGITQTNIHGITNKIQKTIMTVSFLFLLIGVAVYFLQVNVTVIKPVRNVLTVVKDIAQGEADLTIRLNVNTSDEIGELGRWLNTFMDRLHDIIDQVRDNTERVVTAANEISHTSSKLASGAEEQTKQAGDVAVSVQEMSATIFQNSQNANQTAELAEEASVKAREGNEAMQETRQGMEEIVVSSGKTGEFVTSLSSRADQIGEIIQVIDDIAEQTNLLALNAAIEAARAGEQGRGFAVVADEVRELAERTTKATMEIAETIKAIQNDTNETSKFMSETNLIVDKGKEKMLKTEKVLDDIVQSVTRAMDMVRQIATASEEMSSGAKEISKNVDAISDVTKDSASGADKMAGTADMLSRQTEELRNLVEQFKLKEALSQTVPDHLNNGELNRIVVEECGPVKQTSSVLRHELV